MFPIPSGETVRARGETVRHARNGMTILLTTADEARIRIDDTMYRLSAGCITVLMSFHRIASDSQSEEFGFRHLCFDFMADFPLLIPPEASERFSATPVLRADAQSFEALMRCYDTMLEYALMQEHLYRSGIVKAQLFTFFPSCCSAMGTVCGKSAVAVPKN